MMLFRNQAPFTLTASVALALLAGCASGSSQIAPMPLGQTSGSGTQPFPQQGVQAGRQRGIFNPLESMTSQHPSTTAITTGLIFASDVLNNTVYILSQKGKNKVIGQITGLNNPTGLAVDVVHNLYVANQNTAAVPVYAPPYTNGPKLMLDDTGNNPQGVAISAHGVVAVPNFCNASSCRSFDDVTFYAKGSTKPCATIPVPDYGITGSGAFDDAGNLYLVGQIFNTNNQFIGEIRGGCKATKTQLLSTNSALGHLGGVQVDKADRIAILGLDSGIIYTFNPPKHGSLGDPVSTTTLNGGGGFGFVFLASGNDLYANQNLADLYEYDYPAGGSPEHTIPFSRVDAVAVSPPFIP